MSNSVSVRIETRTRAQMAGDRAHVLRNKRPDYVDPERVDANRVLIEPPTIRAAVAQVEQRRRERWERGELHRQPGALRRDGVAALSGIITFGTEAQETIRGLEAGEQDRLYLAAARKIAETLGVDLTGCVVHADESAPHAHLQFSATTPDGEPVSGRLKKSMLSALQDAAAGVYAEVGIERGRSVRQRRAEGAPRHQIVHRSVAELHADLPAEIEQARARVAEMESRVAETRRKLEEGGQDEAKLKKRLQTYETRLKKRRQEAKSMLQDVPPPAPIAITQQIEPGTWRKSAETKDVKVVRPADVQRYAQRIADRVAAHEDRAQQQRERADALRHQLDTIEDAAKQWSRGAWERDALPHAEALIDATQRVTRYGVICATTPRQIAAPPQAATAKQIAAAIYSHGREQGWRRLAIRCQPDVQREILRLAAEDDRLQWVQGADPSIRAEVEAEPPKKKGLQEGFIPSHVPVVSRRADDPDLDDLTPT